MAAKGSIPLAELGEDDARRSFGRLLGMIRVRIIGERRQAKGCRRWRHRHDRGLGLCAVEVADPAVAVQAYRDIHVGVLIGSH